MERIEDPRQLELFSTVVSYFLCADENCDKDWHVDGADRTHKGKCPGCGAATDAYQHEEID